MLESYITVKPEKEINMVLKWKESVKSIKYKQCLVVALGGATSKVMRSPSLWARIYCLCNPKDIVLFGYRGTGAGGEGGCG